MQDGTIIKVNGDQNYRLVPLTEYITRYNDKYKTISRRILAKVMVGHYVKLCAAALGLPKESPEQIWVKIVERRGRKFRGEVRTKTQRWAYHGVKFMAILDFEIKHIITLRLEDMNPDDIEEALGL